MNWHTVERWLQKRAMRLLIRALQRRERILERRLNRAKEWIILSERGAVISERGQRQRDFFVNYAADVATSLAEARRRRGEVEVFYVQTFIARDWGKRS